MPNLLHWQHVPREIGLLFPTCNRPCSGQSELTKHRQNSSQCQDQYWVDMHAIGICINEGFGKLANTIKDLERYMRYHCGDRPNTFRNNLLIRPGDVRAFNGVFWSARSNVTRNCTLCNYSRGNTDGAMFRARKGATLLPIEEGRWAIDIPFHGHVRNISETITAEFTSHDAICAQRWAHCNVSEKWRRNNVGTQTAWGGKGDSTKSSESTCEMAYK